MSEHGTRGYTLIELLIALALVGILGAISLPVMIEANKRNAVWTGAERVGTQIRQARLLAISHNATVRVRFDCPAAGQFRALMVTGDPIVDDAADRCDNTVQYDSGVIPMPENVSFGTVPTLQVSGRGIFTSIGGAIPQTITVGNGAITRTLTVSATGQITFSD